MEITPDNIVYYEWEFITINATLVYTSAVMALLVIVSLIVTLNLKITEHRSRLQNILEVIVISIRNQIKEVTGSDPKHYLPFVGALYLFLAIANFLVFIPEPFYYAPTASINTTGALALCAFFAVPAYGIYSRGFWGYLKTYVQPAFFMLPFKIIGEVSRTVALAIRLFGNMMSGSMLVAILVSLIPFLVPAVMNVLGLLIGQIQAYIFAVLVTVFIASAEQSHEKTAEITGEKKSEKDQEQQQEKKNDNQQQPQQA